MSEPDQLTINEEIGISLDEFEVTYSRSGGPGGQNVNKVNSKVRIRWTPATSATLPASVMERFVEKFRARLTESGELIITSQKFRDQQRNFQDCLDKLRLMIVGVVDPPKIRRPTKPSRAARQKRHESKQVQSNKKQQRRAPSIEE